MTEENTRMCININENLVVDLSLLYQIAGDDQLSINKIVQTFTESMPQTLRRLENAISNKSWQEAYKAAHFSKSSLSVVVVGNMLDLARQIENNCRYERDLQSVPTLFDKMKQQYEAAHPVLSEKYGENLSF